MLIALRKFKYRFRCRKRSYRKKNRVKLFLILILVSSSIVFGYCKIEKRIGEIAQDGAISVLNGEITREINHIIDDALMENGIDKNDIISVSEDDGMVKSLNTDCNKINKIKSTVTIKIQEKLDNMDIVRVKIPVGLIFSDTLMTGYGVNVPFRVFSTSSMDIQFYDEFSSAGINQTRCKLWFEIKIPICVAGIITYQEDEIITQVPIAEKIIMGEVPQVYLNR